MHAAGEIKGPQYANSVSGIVDSFMLNVSGAASLLAPALNRNALFDGIRPGGVINFLRYSR